MKIKEVCGLTGLSERTIRFYVEKQLCTPATTEQNGKQFRDYSTADVNTLRTVATLRRMLFSLEEIAQMQQHSEKIPDVLTEYRARIAEEAEIRAEVLSMDAAALARCTSVTQLAQQMRTAAARHRLPATDAAPDFGKLDADGPHNPDAELQAFRARAEAKVRRGQQIVWVLAALNVLLELVSWILGGSNWARFLVAVIFSVALASGKRWARILFLVGAGLAVLMSVYVLLTVLPEAELTAATRTGLITVLVLLLGYDAAVFGALLKSPSVAAYFEDAVSE